MHDLCAIIVSFNDRDWLDAALGSLYARAGEIDLDVVVVDNGADGAAEHVEESFSRARTLRCPNHGFAHANNRGLESADARYVLFINPDTELLEGTLADLVSRLDREPAVGLLGVRQLYADGTLAPTMRRFPSLLNMLAETLGIEKLPGLRRFLGERRLDLREYDRETPCDWTSGSFMLARGEALAAAGGFDERFFLFSEETDLCWRIRQAGWEVVHSPLVTIRHDEGGAWATPQLEAQNAYSRIQFARKNFSAPRAACFRALLGLRYALRIGFYAAFRRGDDGRTEAARAALATVRDGRPPFGLEAVAPA